MKKIVSLCLVLIMLCSIFTLGACNKKIPEAELAEAQKFAAQIEVKIDKKIKVDDKEIKFSVVNNSDRDCHIRGPLGGDRLQFLFSQNPEIFSFVANSDKCHTDEDYRAGCQTYNETDYLTVPAGTTVEYTLKAEWFTQYKPNTYKLILRITDDVTDGIFESTIEKRFELV